MRALVRCILALGLAALPALAKAATPGSDDSPSAAEAKESNQPAADSSNSSAADPRSTAAKAEPSSLELENQLQDLRELMETRTAEMQQQIDTLQAQLRAAKGGAEAAVEPTDPADSSESANTAFGLPGLGSNASGGSGPDQEGPNTISFKGVSLTPGGFMAAETVWRQHALSADVNTPFNSIPFQGSPGAHVTEFNASGRQSRISMLVQGKLSTVEIGGYYEADFLSAGTTSNYNQSNSFTFRQRQFWGQAAFDNGWTITGGQMWSLATEYKQGLDNRSEHIPLTIDAQYQVGFSWARQFGFRVVKDFGNKVWLGASIENAETLAAFHGQSANASGSPDFLLGQFGASGGLLNPVANFAYSTTPDFIFKAAFQPTRWSHFELFGIVRDFRDRVYPCFEASSTVSCAGYTAPTGVGAFNTRALGGGFGGNALVTVLRKADLGVHFLGGDGVGRYGTSNLPDVTIRETLNTPNASREGTLALIHSYQALGSIELHPTQKLDVYLYAGGEYAGRAQYTNNPSANPILPAFPNEGYGAIGFANYGCRIEQVPLPAPSTSSIPTTTNPGTGYVPTGVGGGTGYLPGALSGCVGDTRYVIEGTFGFWYRFYKGSHGTIQWGPQYSYVERNTWRGCNENPVSSCGTGTVDGNPVPASLMTNGQPHAVENMLFTSFRYYLP